MTTSHRAATRRDWREDNNMIVDIRTPDYAFDSLLNFLDISDRDFINTYAKFQKDIDKVWKEFINCVETKSIKDIEFIAFQVTSNSNNCAEIKKNGIRNLQWVLSNLSDLRNIFAEHEIYFDIKNKKMFYKTDIINIDYAYYCGENNLSSREKKFKEISRKIYNDCQATVFFSMNDVKKYGTRIHERPEFIYTFIKAFPELKDIETEWFKKSSGYIITFRINFEQLLWFTFCDVEYDCLDESERNEILKKWIFSNLIRRSFEHLDDYTQIIAYIKPEALIKPEQIINYEKII